MFSLFHNVCDLGNVAKIMVTNIQNLAIFYYLVEQAKTPNLRVQSNLIHRNVEIKRSRNHWFCSGEM